MSSLTPSNQYDSAFPGENWFFYWKTSPSLWEAKLKEFPGGTPIFVPINWSFHVLDFDRFDFADQKPETDLKKLFSMAHALGKEICFLLPLGPQPYLPYGGLPSALAKTMSINSDGLALAVVDNEERVNKIYSFFDPKVYQSFRKFAWHLGQYLSTNGISSPVFGLRSGYIHQAKFIPYWEDQSEVYEQAFNRFIRSQLAEKGMSAENLSLEDKIRFKIDFLKLIKELYSQSAKESLTSLWAGEIDVAFLGGGRDDMFSRTSFMWEKSQHYFDTLFEVVSNKIIPSTALLRLESKTPVLRKAFNDFLTSGFLYKKIDTKLYEDDYLSTYTPLVHFEIYYQAPLAIRSPEKWTDLGLMSFFKREFKWSYNFNYQVEVNLEEDYIDAKVHIFSGYGITKDDVNKMIKLFLAGAKIILDTNGLTTDLERKLSLFFMENSIQTEKVNFLTTVTHAALGEGKFILFEGDKVENTGLIKKISFWENLISFINLKHMKIEDEDELYHFWKFRTPKMSEMNYEQIRRLSFYNPSDVKKRARIVGTKNFALLKIIDEQDSKVKPSTMGIDLEVLPGGSVSLDFGFFE
ncbi:MAG: hypothetical protein ACOYL6_01240 [Bacteriovoracaceae bacterium]